jgi:hypothetical protein
MVGDNVVMFIVMIHCFTTAVTGHPALNSNAAAPSEKLRLKNFAA